MHWMVSVLYKFYGEGSCTAWRSVMSCMERVHVCIGEEG
jgi:hypothetical protein